MRLGEGIRAAALTGLIVSSCGGVEAQNAFATRTPEVAAASTGPRLSTASNAPRTLETDSPIFRPYTPPVSAEMPEFADPTKKLVADYLRAFFEVRLDDLMNMTAAPYRASNYRQAMQGYMFSYMGCMERRIVDISIVEDQGRVSGIATFDKACKVDFGPNLNVSRDHITVLFQKVDGRQQPIGISIN